MCSGCATKMSSNLLLVIVAVICGILCEVVGFQQQYFRVTPRNTRGAVGSEAVLQCAVANLAGQVQWAKDGFALGYSSVIPGYPRHTMFGERRAGVYNLRVVNLTLADEGEYQCQVGPANLHKVIRANASLTVIAPPTSVEMSGHPHGSKLEVKENSDVTLECVVKNAKPPAAIVWYKGSVQLKGDIVSKEEVKPVESSNGNPKLTRFNTISRIEFKASSEDDYADFTCESRHEALPRDAPLRASVQFSVLYPPGAPYIEGYSEGSSVRAGQSVSLVCRSRGGNPPAQLVWYKNGEQVRMAYRTAGRMSENVLTFVAAASDNKARFSCEAKNVMITDTLRAHVDLSVLFAPLHVSISGSTEARVGDSVPLSCVTGASNPAAEVKWVIAGRQQRALQNDTSIAPEGGWVTRSNISVLVEPSRRSVVAVCHGINTQLADSVVATHTIHVFYPPSPPMITGYTPGAALSAGGTLRLLCVSGGGNPPPQLHWYKNNKKIPSTVRNMEGSVGAELSLVVDVSDNLAQYRCEASNSATDIPLREDVTLNVHFPPESVQVSWSSPGPGSPPGSPSGLPPGPARLRCDGASSHPPASLSWWRGGIPVQGETMTMKKGLHGGTVSSIELELNLTKELNGAVYTCQAMNEALQRSVHDALTLTVLYPPEFVPSSRESEVGIAAGGASASETVECVVNSSVQLSAPARAQPTDIAYTWSKDGLPLTGQAGITISKSVLSINRVDRGSAGVYTVEATNTQGATTKNITLNILYAASVVSSSQRGDVDSEQDAILTCTADGNPLKGDHFRWERTDTTIDPEQVTYDPQTLTSTLTVKRPTRADVGNWSCIVDNGLGTTDKREVLLVIPFQPEVDESPSLTKAAANVGQTVRLTCSCLAYPLAEFKWYRGDTLLSPSHKYSPSATAAGSDPLRHASTLLVREVTSSDYGDYWCEVSNKRGSARLQLRLVTSGPPEMVSVLWIVNVTSSSVSLAWSPGFDGGSPASYRIRYRRVDSDVYSYTDVSSSSPPQHTVTSLQPHTQYVFSVMSITSRGQSRYRPDDVTATTHSPSAVGVAGATGTAGASGATGTAAWRSSPALLAAGALLAAALLLVNALLAARWMQRRRKRERASPLSPGVPAASPAAAASEAGGGAILYVSISGAILVALNAALIACFLLRRRANRLKEVSGTSLKSAAIEMYAPSSYSPGADSLSQLSDKSEEPPPLPDMPHRHTVTSSDGYLVSDSGLLPPPMEYPAVGTLGTGGYSVGTDGYNVGTDGYRVGTEYPEYPPDYSVSYSPREVHARTLPRHRDTNTGVVYGPAPSPCPPCPPLDGSYYNMSSDRYLSYPPVLADYMPQSALSTSAGYATVRREDNDHAHNYDVDVSSLHGTLRRHNKLTACLPPTHTSLPSAQPPPDVTRTQIQSPAALSPPVKQPQSILKAPRRVSPASPAHTTSNTTGTTTGTTTGNTTGATGDSQILTVHTLHHDTSAPHYGTIRKDHKIHHY